MAYLFFSLPKEKVMMKNKLMIALRKKGKIINQIKTKETTKVSNKKILKILSNIKTFLYLFL